LTESASSPVSNSTHHGQVKESAGPLEQVLQAIDNGLRVYGSSVPPVVYFQLENRFGLKKEDIPKRPEVFVELIDGFFGGGSNAVKLCIIRELSKISGLGDLPKMQLAVALREASHYFQRVQQGYSPISRDEKRYTK